MSSGPVYVTPVAKSTPFDNGTNGYIATDVQAAIEESLTTAVSSPRYSIVTVHNGTISNNQWLSYSNLVPGDVVPIVIPVDSILREISFSFNKADVNGVFDIYLDGIAGGNIQYSITFTNETTSKLTTAINLSLPANTLLRGRWVDTGTNPSDMCITYYPQVQI